MFHYDQHIFGFVTFIFGFIVANIFRGWADWINNPDRYRITPLKLLWSLLFMLLLIEYWWGLWEHRTFVSGSFVNFVFTVFLTGLFYFGAVFLFDTARSDDLPARDAYFRSIKPVAIIVALIIICQSVQAQLHRTEPMLALQNAERLGGVFSMMLLYFVQSTILHAAIFALSLLLLLVYIAEKHMGATGLLPALH